jgi:hypothetical protein
MEDIHSPLSIYGTVSIHRGSTLDRLSLFQNSLAYPYQIMLLSPLPLLRRFHMILAFALITGK